MALLLCLGNLALFGAHFWSTVSAGCFTVISRGEKLYDKVLVYQTPSVCYEIFAD